MKNEPFDFNQFSESTVEQVYNGWDSGCRCGCHGNYFTMKEDSRRALSFIRRAKKLVDNGEGTITDTSITYVNISYGNNRAITIYLNPLYMLLNSEIVKNKEL